MMTNEAKQTTKMTCEEFREAYRVSVGQLPDGNMIEVVAAKITNDNYQTIPSMSAFRHYLDELYGCNHRIIFESLSSLRDVFIFEWRPKGK